MCRKLAIPDLHTYEELLTHLQQLGLDSQSAVDIALIACDDTWTAHVISPHLRRLIEDAHCFTWLSVEGVNGCAHTMRGSCA
eukprot:9087111-Karenia_brevis.AAC.1